MPPEAWLRGALDRFERPLIAYSARLLGDVDQARDVVQDTFLRLCDNARTEDARRNLEPHLAEWLYTVCRNRAIDVYRKAKRLVANPEGGLIDPLDAEPTPGAKFERREAASDILRELATLPASQQEVIHLRFRQGLSYKEIASITDRTVNHVGVLLHNGLKTLRARMSRHPFHGASRLN